ncbi:hypothetical protein DFH27DRAFT_546490, partial [Peziza echinospora]
MLLVKAAVLAVLVVLLDDSYWLSRGDVGMNCVLLGVLVLLEEVFGEFGFSWVRLERLSSRFLAPALNWVRVAVIEAVMELCNVMVLLGVILINREIGELLEVFALLGIVVVFLVNLDWIISSDVGMDCILLSILVVVVVQLLGVGVNLGVNLLRVVLVVWLAVIIVAVFNHFDDLNNLNGLFLDYLDNFRTLFVVVALVVIGVAHVWAVAVVLLTLVDGLNDMAPAHSATL